MRLPSKLTGSAGLRMGVRPPPGRRTELSAPAEKPHKTTYRWACKPTFVGKSSAQRMAMWPYQSAGSSKAATQRAGPRSGVSGVSVRDCAIQPSGWLSGCGAGKSDTVTGSKPTRP